MYCIVNCLYFGYQNNLNTQQKNNRRISVRAKKSLGQHFLTSQKVVDIIVAEAKLTRSDTVLEIGPGRGILTHALLQIAGHVIAVEKDEKLTHKLELQFKHDVDQKKLTLIPTDILTLPFGKYIPKDFIVVANIPYYITGRLLRKLLSGKWQPKRVVLMLQHEVAERIVARTGKESLLSIGVRAYGTPRYIFKVYKRHFKPQPKVDSAVLSIENISRSFFKKRDEKLFFQLVRNGFSHKRKLLKRNVEPFFTKNTERVFLKCGIRSNIRAEEVSLKQWGCLADKISG